MSVHLEEFLYRGRPEGSSEPPAWQITLLSIDVDGFGEKKLSSKTLNIAQAEAAGWPLPEVLKAINTGTFAEIEVQRAENAALAAALAEAEHQVGAHAATIARAERLLASAAETVAAQKEAIAGANADRDITAATLIEREETLQRTTTERDELTARLAAAEAEVTRLTTSLSAAEAEVARLTVPEDPPAPVTAADSPEASPTEA